MGSLFTSEENDFESRYRRACITARDREIERGLTSLGFSKELITHVMEYYHSIVSVETNWNDFHTSDFKHNLIYFSLDYTTRKEILPKSWFLNLFDEIYFWSWIQKFLFTFSSSRLTVYLKLICKTYRTFLTFLV